MEGSLGEIITFYSYKGGTGRSMAMANVAQLLATADGYGGKRVLAIDWDLEAPGLQMFFRKRFASSFGPPGTSGYDEGVSGALGLIDLLTSVAQYYGQAFPDQVLPESMAREPAGMKAFAGAMERFPLHDYLLRIDEAASLSLMTAGRRPVAASGPGGYWDKVRGFDWDQFYQRYGSFFTHFRELLSKRFDYVLIDSRTGLTDTGGICTRVMPQKLVVVFAPNRQNIDGVTRVAEKSVRYRMRSRDPRGLVVYPLASRIDASASKLRGIWWRGGKLEDDHVEGYQKTFEELFSELYQLDQCDLTDYFDETQVPHDSDYAYGEEVAAWRDGTADRFGIGHACEQLAKRLVLVPAPWETLSTEAAPGSDAVFISYRRSDAAAYASLLHDALSGVYGLEVVMDVDSILSGPTFASGVEELIRRAGVFLVVIGPSWAERLSDPDDLTRREVALGLHAARRVVPVLVQGASFPDQESLPEELADLAAIQAFVLSDDRFESDMDQLARSLKRFLGVESGTLRPSGVGRDLSRPLPIRLWRSLVRIAKRIWAVLTASDPWVDREDE